MKSRGGKIGGAVSMLMFLLPFAAAAFTPNDPLLSEQWYLSTVGAFEAWETTRGDPAVVVAVIDSGVDINHPDLAANIWTNPKEVAGNGIDDDGNGFVDDIHGWDFLSSSPDPRPKAESGSVGFAHHHGTAVSGIIAAVADNRRGLSGVAPRVTIMPLRALDSTGKGTSSTVIKAIDYAVANGAAIINLSFVSTLERSPGPTNPDTLFFRSIERARQRGVLVVAAGGNEATAEKTEVVDLDVNPQVPVCEDPSNPFQAVIGVAATDREDHRAAFSSFGRRCIDLSAPGAEFFVLTAHAQPVDGVAQESYSGYYKGTSLAAPIVSAAAALLKSIDRTLTPEALQSILEESSDPIERGTIYEGRVGRGRVNIAKAVARVRARASSVPFAQSVSGASSEPVRREPVAAVRALPPALPKTATVEQVLLALNERNSTRLVRVDHTEDAGFEQIVKLPGTVTSIAALRSGGFAVARVLSGRPTEIILFTSDGVPVKSWFPFGPKFFRASEIAVGDVDGDGVEDVVVGAGAGGSPDVAVLSVDGSRKAQFLAYAKTFRGGVAVAVGNVLGSGADEIVTVPLSKAPAHVRVFDGQGRPQVQFFAASQRDRAGASVALLNRGPDQAKNIAVSFLQKTSGELKVFGSDGVAQSSVLAFDSIDRAFMVHRDHGSAFVTVAARAKPSIVGVLSAEGKRERLLKLPKNIESVALGTIQQTVIVP